MNLHIISTAMDLPVWKMKWGSSKSVQVQWGDLFGLNIWTSIIISFSSKEDILHQKRSHQDNETVDRRPVRGIGKFGHFAVYFFFPPAR